MLSVVLKILTAEGHTGGLCGEKLGLPSLLDTDYSCLLQRPHCKSWLESSQMCLCENVGRGKKNTKNTQTQRAKEEEEMSEKHGRGWRGLMTPDRADVPLKRLRLLEILWSIEWKSRSGREILAVCRPQLMLRCPLPHRRAECALELNWEFLKKRLPLKKQNESNNNMNLGILQFFFS